MTTSRTSGTTGTNKHTAATSKPSNGYADIPCRCIRFFGRIRLFLGRCALADTQCSTSSGFALLTHLPLHRGRLVLCACSVSLAIGAPLVGDAGIPSESPLARAAAGCIAFARREDCGTLPKPSPMQGKVPSKARRMRWNFLCALEVKARRHPLCAGGTDETARICGKCGSAGGGVTQTDTASVGVMETDAEFCGAPRRISFVWYTSEEPHCSTSSGFASRTHLPRSSCFGCRRQRRTAARAGARSLVGEGRYQKILTKKENMT